MAGKWEKAGFFYLGCEWEEKKRLWTIRERKVDFADISEILKGGRGISRMDDRKDYKEVRYQGMAEIELRVFFFAFTVRLPAVARIISARKTNQRETNIFRKEMSGEDQTEQ